VSLEASPQFGDLSSRTSERPRPALHFTAEDGWINDPYGVTWSGDRYHLFYQAIPGQVTWGANAHWGHAYSTDLVHWTEQPLALVPGDYEVGCWSGSVAVGEDGQPVILYTRITGTDYGRGQVAVAYGDESFTHWRKTPDDVVIAGPPTQPAVLAMRDPFVFRHDGRWVAILAAGLNDGSGAALQYVSPDLRAWSFDGVLSSRASTPADHVWTGSIWECPQFFRLNEAWVLLVSVWDDDELYYVAGAVGGYDGRTFTPRSWQRITYGNCAYAMTAFEDRDGRRCVMSWLREEPRNNPGLTVRASAHSLVSELTIDDAGILTLSPHPHFDALSRYAPPTRNAGKASRFRVGVNPVEIVVGASSTGHVLLTEDGESRLEVEVEAGVARIHRAGHPTENLPCVSGALRVVVDADIVEIFSGGCYGAYRISPAHKPGVTEVTCTGNVSVLAVEAHATDPAAARTLLGAVPRS
jgi:beta-fructofuranosidase